MSRDAKSEGADGPAIYAAVEQPCCRQNRDGATLQNHIAERLFPTVISQGLALSGQHSYPLFYTKDPSGHWSSTKRNLNGLNISGYLASRFSRQRYLLGLCFD